MTMLNNHDGLYTLCCVNLIVYDRYDMELIIMVYNQNGFHHDYGYDLYILLCFS
jgi:hypothetical protein